MYFNQSSCTEDSKSCYDKYYWVLVNMFLSRTRTLEKTKQKGSVHALAISTFMVFLCVLFVFLMPLMKKRISKRKKGK